MLENRYTIDDKVRYGSMIGRIISVFHVDKRHILKKGIVDVDAWFYLVAFDYEISYCNESSLHPVDAPIAIYYKE